MHNSIKSADHISRYGLTVQFERYTWLARWLYMADLPSLAAGQQMRSGRGACMYMNRETQLANPLGMHNSVLMPFSKLNMSRDQDIPPDVLTNTTPSA